MGMALSKAILLSLDNCPKDFQDAFLSDYYRREKSVIVGYLAWLFLGWHYLYLGRVGVQFAFWFTGGFFIIGWLVDFFRVWGMVSRHNQDVARELAIQYKAMAGGM